jgi:signal peptidase I
MQVMWVRGPSMTPYLNEDYDQMQTKSDMVLVNMWPWGGILPFRKERKLERGTVVTFRLVFSVLCLCLPSRSARPQTSLAVPEYKLTYYSI